MALAGALGIAGGCDQGESPQQTGHSRAAVTAPNGIYFNGVGTNGILVNGFSLNGAAPNGIYFNGQSSNGIYFNGQSPNGIYFNSLSLNGVYFNGIYFNGLSRNGIGTNGVGVNGLHLNGIYFNGIYFNGIYFNSVNLNGVYFNSLSFNGIYFNGAPLTPEQEEAVDILLYHLVGCALADGDSVTIPDFYDGTDKTYYGLRGFAPEWKTEPLSDEGNEAVSACLQSATSEGLTITNGTIPVNAEEQARVEKLFEYMIQCALPEGDSVLIDDERYDGALGLAPDWKTSLPTPSDMKKVSACLAARANANQQTVVISLRGLGMEVDSIERARYAWHEGGFWADLFSETPYIKTCAVEGGISGRVCTEPDGCGFEDVGDCAAVCATVGEDGAYSDCGPTVEPLVVSTFMNLATTMTFGWDYDCVKLVDGSLWCWGGNYWGQCGNGEVASFVESPYRHSLPGAAASIEAGYASTCARLRDGTAWCWGKNEYGQLGVGSTEERLGDPTQVADLGADVAALHVGFYHGCAIKTDGTLWCWGENQNGKLGDGTTEDRDRPVQVASLGSEVVYVAPGAWHTCAIKLDGTVWCWGENWSGQLGLGNTENQVLPVQVQTDIDGVPFGGESDPAGAVLSLCAGVYHSCALKADGSVWCWGDNYDGQIGDGTGVARDRPVRVAADVAADGLACGWDHVCVNKNDGTVWCWGDNTYGQLGDGSIEDRLAPTQVLGTSGRKRTAFTEATAMFPGSYHTCARRADDSVWCWGYNDRGQLGDGSFTDLQSSVPIENLVLASLPVCGDAACTGDETEQSCPEDCTGGGGGACATCQVTDCGLCGAKKNGTCKTCEVTDCGACGSL